ncbi:MAG: 4-hydroxy-tetrahydrodipicolinate synthase [Actinobacteria bacterium]|nr:4-hydroxy-tetrahydrodipicolinate synthase [Actinomycetota bacterium]MCL5445297.1 4-hydroxy-tetrahydrodipicolinate synthase [Actinomycetota bacterium]
MMPLTSQPRFGAVITAMVTPFDDDGAIDLDSAASLARWLVNHGSDGLVLSGTTGEGPVLSDGERIELWRCVAGAVTVPVIAGTGTNDTRHSVKLTEEATAAGVDGVLVVTPYYNRPSQAGLYEHFTSVAGSTDLPVVLYDIPVRTGRRIDPDNLVRIARDSNNIVAVKDATGDVASAARVIADTPDGFELYSGEDSLTLPLLAVGAAGVISVASHWAGQEFGDMIASFWNGDNDAAREQNAKLIPSYRFESTEKFPNPLPVKAACRAMGLGVGQCRPPMGAAPTELVEEARRVVEDLSDSTSRGE